MLRNCFACRDQGFRLLAFWGSLAPGALATILILATGCGQQAASEFRTGSPAESAAAVMSQCDANRDGKVDAKELEASPALADGLPRIDVNRDKAIDAAEMQARFEAHDKMSDVVGFDLSVTAKRKPLVGAVVTFTPERFMGEGKQSYVGTAGNGGAAYLEGEREKMLGVPTGFYSVHIVHEPSKVDVTRGCEVADDTPSPNRLEFDTVLTGVKAQGR